MAMKTDKKNQRNAEKNCEVIVLQPLPKEDSGKKKIPLSCLRDVRLEMSKIYRLSRAGKLESQELSRLVFALGQIGKIIELETFEQRIERLERGLPSGN